MLVATTRKRADPAEMFFGARGPALSFANIIVSIPPSNARQIGEVQWPRQVPGDAATEFVTLKADVIERPKALAWFHRTFGPSPSARFWSSFTGSTTASTTQSFASRRSYTTPMRP